MGFRFAAIGAGAVAFGLGSSVFVWRGPKGLFSMMDLAEEASREGTWAHVAHCEGTRSKFMFDPELLPWLLAGASHAKLCARSREGDCIESSMDNVEFKTAHADGKLVCKLRCRHEAGSVCSWLEHTSKGRRRRGGLEVFLSPEARLLGAQRVQAQAGTSAASDLEGPAANCTSGPPLGRMSALSCALACPRWGRFVRAGGGNSDCRCAGLECRPESVNQSGASLYELPAPVAVAAKMAGIVRVRGPAKTEVPLPFDRCALIGSSKDLVGSGLGGEIDAHDTVIRVNRIPLAEHVTDYGRRTDVLFIGAVQRNHRMITSKGQWYWSFGGSRHLCPFRSPGCPFKLVVLKYGKRRKPPSDAAFLVGQVTERASEFAEGMLQRFVKHHVIPTSGFHAFTTFGLLCNSLTMYGFSGNETVDGHNFTGVHSVTLVQQEHDLVRRIMAAELHDKHLDMPLLQRLQDRRGRHRVVQPPR